MERPYCILVYGSSTERDVVKRFDCIIANSINIYHIRRFLAVMEVD